MKNIAKLLFLFCLLIPKETLSAEIDGNENDIHNNFENHDRNVELQIENDLHQVEGVIFTSRLLIFITAAVAIVAIVVLNNSNELHGAWKFISERLHAQAVENCKRFFGTKECNEVFLPFETTQEAELKNIEKVIVSSFNLEGVNKDSVKSELFDNSPTYDVFDSRSVTLFDNALTYDIFTNSVKSAEDCEPIFGTNNILCIKTAQDCSAIFNSNLCNEIFSPFETKTELTNVEKATLLVEQCSFNSEGVNKDSIKNALFDMLNDPKVVNLNPEELVNEAIRVCQPPETIIMLQKKHYSMES